MFCSSACLSSALASYHRVESTLPVQALFHRTGQQGYDEISGTVLLVLRWELAWSGTPAQGRHAPAPQLLDLPGLGGGGQPGACRGRGA